MKEKIRNFQKNKNRKYLTRRAALQEIIIKRLLQVEMKGTLGRNSNPH
jgi:hypothetical protein